MISRTLTLGLRNRPLSKRKSDLTIIQYNEAVEIDNFVQNQTGMDLQPFVDHISKHIQLTAHEQSIFLSKVKFRKYLKGQFRVQKCNQDIKHMMRMIGGDDPNHVL
jgi:hypothetical protein